jgi:hypothetical protein
MRATVIIIFVSVALVFTGCATTPKSELEMKADLAEFELPKLPENGRALVYIVRPTSLGILVDFNVYLDTKEPESKMGCTHGLQYIYFNLEPGEHLILSKAENWAEIVVSAAPGDILFIQQEVNMGFFVARNSLSILSDYEGKYHVKNCTLGKITKVDK